MTRKGNDMGSILDLETFRRARGKSSPFPIPTEFSAEDCVVCSDVNPPVRDGYALDDHRLGGVWGWRPGLVEALSLFSSDRRSLERLRGDFSSLNACWAEWFLAHPNCIPEDWRHLGEIFFLDTVFQKEKDGARCMLGIALAEICWVPVFRHIASPLGLHSAFAVISPRHEFSSHSQSF